MSPQEQRLSEIQKEAAMGMHFLAGLSKKMPRMFGWGKKLGPVKARFDLAASGMGRNNLLGLNQTAQVFGGAGPATVTKFNRGAEQLAASGWRNKMKGILPYSSQRLAKKTGGVFDARYGADASKDILYKDLIGKGNVGGAASVGSNLKFKPKSNYVDQIIDLKFPGDVTKAELSMLKARKNPIVYNRMNAYDKAQRDVAKAGTASVTKGKLDPIASAPSTKSRLDPIIKPNITTGTRPKLLQKEYLHKMKMKNMSPEQQKAYINNSINPKERQFWIDDLGKAPGAPNISSTIPLRPEGISIASAKVPENAVSRDRTIKAKKIADTKAEAQKTQAAINAKKPPTPAQLEAQRFQSIDGIAPPPAGWGNPEAKGPMELIKLWQGGGAFTPQQKRMVMQYGVMGVLAKPYVDNMLGA